MADVEATEYAKYNANPPTLGDTRRVNGSPKVLHDKLVFASNAVDDKGFFAKIPSNAIILPSSTIYHEAAGTNVTVNIGDANDPDGLATLVAVASAGSFGLLEAVAVGDLGKPAWQMLNYAEDPKRILDLFYTVKGATTGASVSMVHEIFYV